MIDFGYVVVGKVAKDNSVWGSKAGEEVYLCRVPWLEWCKTPVSCFASEEDARLSYRPGLGPHWREPDPATIAVVPAVESSE